MRSYGRNAVAEPYTSIFRMHHHDSATQLHAVDHEPSIPVLDQEDLIAQGIDTSKLIPGAPKADELGSCVANATTAALAAVLPAVKLRKLGIGSGAVTDEEFAIRLYHALTDLTGDPSSEWPPTDCGSSGLYSCQYLEAQKITSGHKVASGAENVVSLMQSGGLIVGQPFFYSWEEPDASGFIDGNGSAAAYEAAVQSGVAGGHETYWEAIEKIAFTRTGSVDAQGTVIRFRNSWSASWGEAGCARAHLSTFMRLGSQVDYRLLVA